MGRWCDAAEPSPRFVPPVLVAVAFVDGADAVPLVLPVAVAVLEAVLPPPDTVDLDDEVVEFWEILLVSFLTPKPTKELVRD